MLFVDSGGVPPSPSLQCVIEMYPGTVLHCYRVEYHQQGRHANTPSAATTAAKHGAGHRGRLFQGSPTSITRLVASLCLSGTVLGPAAPPGVAAVLSPPSPPPAAYVRYRGGVSRFFLPSTGAVCSSPSLFPLFHTRQCGDMWIFVGAAAAIAMQCGPMSIFVAAHTGCWLRPPANKTLEFVRT